MRDRGDDRADRDERQLGDRRLETSAEEMTMKANIPIA